LILEKEFLFYRNGNAVGYLSRGGFGYSINKSLGTGYVDLQA
jgi:4-methylaminobutanoate oxidase (formaldehyde-forming)